MGKHLAGDISKFEKAFEKYLDAYMNLRDFALLTEMTWNDFCGFGTGLDENFYNKNRGLEIFQRDIAQAPDRLHYTLRHQEIKLLDEFNAIVVAELDLKTMILGQDIKFNNLRMMMVLHEEDKAIKISGIHISFPTVVHDVDETFPLKELEKRAQVLSRMVEEKTKSLQQALGERKQAEDALRNSEERFQKMLALVPDAISIQDPHMNIVYSNWKGIADVPAERRILHTKCYLTYRGFDQICPDCQATGVLENKEAFAAEIENVEGRWLDMRIIPILDDNNNVELFVEWVRDITERKQFEETLKQQNNLMEGIINGVSDVLAIQNPDHTIERYNRAGYRMLNMTHDDVQHNKCYELLGRDRECDACPTTKALQTKKMEQAEKYVPELGLYLDCHSNPVLDEAGNVVQIVLQLKNITDRKKAEEKLQKTVTNINALLANSPALISIIDKEGRYIEVSNSIARVIGLPPETIKGKAFTDLLPSTVASEFMQTVDELRERKHSITKTDIIQIDGEDRIFETFLFPIEQKGTDTELIGAIAIDITERKQAETEISKFKTISDQAIYGSAIADLDGNFIYINDYFARIHGYTPDQLMGKNLLIFHNDKQQHAVKLLTESMKKEGSFAPTEVWHTHKNGTTFPMLMTGMIIKDEAGIPQFLTATAVDITVTKRAEAELKQKSEELDAYFNSSLDLLCIANTNGEFVRLNPEWEKVLGYPLSELEGRSFLDFVHPEDMDATLAAITRLDAQQEVLSFENRYRCKDGSYRWIEWRARLQGITIHAVARDITDRKLAEEALNESEQRFRYIAEFSPLPLAIVSENGNYEYLNPKFIEVFGYTLADIPTGKKWLELAYPDPDYRQQVIQAWKKFREELVKNVAIPKTFTASCKNGMKKEILFRTVLMDNGKHLVVYEDITDRKLTEQKLADYTRELEQLYHKLDTEMDKARQVHERTLPTSLPTVEGISFAAHYQPAQKMGGDLYDVIHKDNKLIFYISDVSGHSLDGAMLSVFIKEAIDSYINLKPDHITPHQILKHLSRQYNRENYDEELYFCIFMAVLDLGTLELSYCGAGFQQEMLLRLGNGKTLQLATKGMFITSYMPPEALILKEETVVITPGTTIFLTSDGLTEQGSQGAYYRDRLPDIFYENAHLPANLVAQTVVEDFRKFNNGSLQGKDDITFLVLQVDK